MNYLQLQLIPNVIIVKILQVQIPEAVEEELHYEIINCNQCDSGNQPLPDYERPLQLLKTLDLTLPDNGKSEINHC